MISPVYFTIIDSNTDSTIYETFIGNTNKENTLKDLYPFIANSAIDVIDSIQSNTNASGNNNYSKSHLQQKTRNLLLNNINDTTNANKTSFYSDNILNAEKNTNSDSEPVYNNNPSTTLQQITSIPQGSLFLGTIDEYESYLITAYVTYLNTKFIIISDKTVTINYNSFKKFFMNVHELYIKQIMNPFNSKNAFITNELFDCKIRVLGDMYILSSSSLISSAINDSSSSSINI